MFLNFFHAVSIVVVLIFVSAEIAIAETTKKTPDEKLTGPSEVRILEEVLRQASVQESRQNTWNLIRLKRELDLERIREARDASYTRNAKWAKWLEIQGKRSK